MGADGGVAWAIAREGAVEKVDALLARWNLQRTGDRTGDASRSEWEQENLNPQWITAPYGTDMGDGPTLPELPWVVDELRDWITDPVYSLDTTATWEDLLLEVQTRPSWMRSTDPSPAERWLKHLAEGARYGFVPPEVMQESVIAWCDAVCEALECGPDGLPVVEREETWT